MQVLVADLQEGTGTVRKRGTDAPIEDAVSADGGTLYFVASGGGIYDLHRGVTGSRPAPAVLPASPAVP
ncbi:hypothetical protein D3C87_2118900 [compost metagenome]